MDQPITAHESTAPPPQPPALDRPHGCLTAFLAGVALFVVGLLGFLWVNTLYTAFSQEIFGSVLAADIARAVLYGLALLVPFGLVVLLLRSERFALWRGIALALAVAGVHALVVGLVLAADRELPWPGVPDVIPPAITFLTAVLVLMLARRRFWDRPVWTIWLGLALGLAASAGWVSAGALGTASELLLAVLEAMANSLLAAVLMGLVTYYDTDSAARHPLWIGLLAGALLMAVQFSLFAVRGWWIQGLMVSSAFLPLSLIAGLLGTLDVRPDPKRAWWAALAFLFAAFLLPFAFTEGLEGDWMLEEMGVAWGRALAISMGLALLFSVVLLVAHAVKHIPDEHTVFARRGLLVLSVLALVLSIGILTPVYLSSQPGLQPETFFVVMAEQADTSFAREIEDRDERTAAVYETLTEHAITTQANLRDFLDEKGMPYTPYYLVNGIEVEGTALLRRQIAARSDVAYILDSPHARPLPESAGSLSVPPQYQSIPYRAEGVDQIDAEIVWDELGVTGERIIVGQADSGVDWRHPALQSQYMGSDGNHDYAWFDPWEGTTEPTDTGGHGTHTLGTVLGQGGIGVAPGARWIACRNLARNLGNPGYYLDCMQFLFAPFPLGGDPFTDGDPARGAHVTNNSWGCPPEEGCDSITLSIGVEHLRNAGQMMIVSAGNEGPACDTVWAPANADAAFTVGAIDPRTGEIASFSSRGPVTGDGSGRIKPDIAAPGVDILSSIPGGAYAESGFSGTSMAGPHVTGLVALLWSADPSLIGDIDATEQIIIDTADEHQAADMCGEGDVEHNNVYGYGRIDADEAVEEALETP